MIKQCEKYFRAHRHTLVILILLSIFNTAVSTISPYITGNIITDISSGHSLSPILDKCKVLLLLFLLSQTMGVICSILKLKIELSMGKEFNCDVIFHIQDLPYTYIQQQNLSALNQSVNQDTNTIIAFCIDLTLNVTTKILNVLCILFLCFSLNIEMSLIIVISSILYTLLYLFLKKKLYVTRKNFRICESNFFAKLFEQLEFIYFIKTNSIQSTFRKRVDDSFSEFSSAKVNDSYLQYLISILQGSISLFSQLLLLTVGAQCVYNGKITIGLLITFSTYFSQVQSGILYFLNLGSSYQNTRVSSQRIYDILSKSKESSGHKMFSPPLSISCKKLSFAFSDEKRLLYENLSFSLQPGKIYGLAGKNGAGKTTFINLLMRFYDVTGGTISIDGHPINEISRHSLRNSFGMVLQDTWIKNGTVRENINIGKPDATDGEIIEAAKRSHSWEFIRRLPNGLDTRLKEDSLSQGEKQLLCITRVMLCLPPMLILDEATSSIDTRTELQIQEAFERMMEGRTSFIVAHRLSTIRNADLILVMKDGSIIEQGTHDELIAKGGFYHTLYNSQFAKVSE